MAVLAQIDGYDPVGATAVSLYACSHDSAPVCHANGQTWWPVIAKLPPLRYDFFDGGFGAQISAPSSSLSLQIEPWPDFGRYILAEARLRLWTGDPAVSSTWTLQVDARITGQPKIATGTAQIDFAADDRWLDTALLQTYAGTGGAEGPAALKGQVKPLALGAPRYVAGKLIDSINSVFQISGYGPINGFEYALEKLARFAAPVADYASYAALVAATVPAGRWATANAAGMARFGAPPAGQISFLVQGDIAGPDGWARKPGQIIRRIALLAGGSGKINDASLNALDTARPYTLSLYLDEQTTARSLIQNIAASVNAVALVSWTGQLFLLPVAIGSGGTVLATDGSSLPMVEKIEQIDMAAPWQKLAIDAERAWTVHALADIAFTAPLVDLGSYASGTSYREGNIVSLADGSRWLYVATTPTSGNMPGTGSAFWNILSTAAISSFRQPTPPADAVEGNIWTDQSNSNTQYRHSGFGIAVNGVEITFNGAQMSIPWQLVSLGWAAIIGTPVALTDGRVAAGLNPDGTAAPGKVVATSMSADIVNKIVSAEQSGVTATDAGALLLVLAGVVTKKSQGGYVHLILTCDLTLSTSPALTSAILWGILQRSPAGAATWSTIKTWRMGFRQHPLYVLSLNSSDPYYGVHNPVDAHSTAQSVAAQFIDVPPSDGSYDYRWLVCKTSTPGAITSPSIGAGVATQAAGVALSVKVAS